MAKPSKNQRPELEAKPVYKRVSYDAGKPCSFCKAGTRTRFAAGRGKNARAQHPKHRVCENGHKLIVKKGGQA